MTMTTKAYIAPMRHVFWGSAVALLHIIFLNLIKFSLLREAFPEISRQISHTTEVSFSNVITFILTTCLHIYFCH